MEPKNTFNLFDKDKLRPSAATRLCAVLGPSKEKNEKERPCPVNGRRGDKVRVKDSLKFPVPSPWIKLGPEWKRYRSTDGRHELPGGRLVWSVTAPTTGRMTWGSTSTTSTS